jgi:hypothetical protein
MIHLAAVRVCRTLPAATPVKFVDDGRWIHHRPWVAWITDQISGGEVILVENGL